MNWKMKWSNVTVISLSFSLTPSFSLFLSPPLTLSLSFFLCKHLFLSTSYYHTFYNIILIDKMLREIQSLRRSVEELKYKKKKEENELCIPLERKLNLPIASAYNLTCLDRKLLKDKNLRSEFVSIILLSWLLENYWITKFLFLLT